MLYNNHKAFTMIELIFVIVVIGILSAIAIPKFAATRGDAEIAKAKATLGSVRSAVATERQKLILRGVFDPITSLSSASGYNKPIFDGINGDTNSPVLEYPRQSCEDSTAQGCWYTADNVTYTYKLPTSGSVDFNLTSSRFTCKLPNSDNCKLTTLFYYNYSNRNDFALKPTKNFCELITCIIVYAFILHYSLRAII